MKYVDVVIDNNSDHTDELYTYGCPFDQVQVGDKVYVPFARGNKRREAYVFTVKDQLDEPVRGLKEVLEIDPAHRRSRGYVPLDEAAVPVQIHRRDQVLYACRKQFQAG